MGNEISKKYEMETGDQWGASGGPGGLWRVFPATRKADGFACSLFLLHKQDHPALKSKWTNTQNKNDLEAIFEIFRKEIKILKDLNHPYILRVYEVFEENKKCLAFVGDRVIGSLANFMNGFQEIPAGPGSGSFSELELGRGVGHLCECVQYIHHVAKLLHLSLNPANIYVTPTGVWRVAGFGHSVSLFGDGHHGAITPYFTDFNLTKFAAPGLRMEPDLRYCAPEMTKPGTRRISFGVDIFSIGVVIWESFHNLLTREQTSNGSISFNSAPLALSKSQSYLMAALSESSTPAEHQSLFLSSSSSRGPSLYPIAMEAGVIPTEIHHGLSLLLEKDHSNRCDAGQFLQIGFFHSGPVATLRAIDALVGKDVGAQMAFLSTLSQTLGTFSTKTQRDAILPPILHSATTHPTLWPYVIPILVQVTSDMPKKEFAKSIQDKLKPALELRRPLQALTLLIDNIMLLADKMDPPFFVENVVPMLERCLESGVPQLQDAVIRKLCLPDLCHMLAAAGGSTKKIMQEDFLPKVGKLMLTTETLGIRVNALIMISKTFQFYDRNCLLKNILPGLSMVLAKDQTPAVIMCVLGCYDPICKVLTPDQICEKVLPALVPLIFAPDINRPQFESLVLRIQNLLTGAIDARRPHVCEEVSQAESAPVVVNGSASGLEEDSFMFGAIPNPKPNPTTNKVSPAKPALGAPDRFAYTQRRASGDNSNDSFLGKGTTTASYGTSAAVAGSVSQRSSNLNRTDSSNLNRTDSSGEGTGDTFSALLAKKGRTPSHDGGGFAGMDTKLTVGRSNPTHTSTNRPAKSENAADLWMTKSSTSSNKRIGSESNNSNKKEYSTSALESSDAEAARLEKSFAQLASSNPYPSLDPSPPTLQPTRAENIGSNGFDLFAALPVGSPPKRPNHRDSSSGFEFIMPTKAACSVSQESVGFLLPTPMNAHSGAMANPMRPLNNNGMLFPSSTHGSMVHINLGSNPNLNTGYSDSRVNHSTGQGNRKGSLSAFSAFDFIEKDGESAPTCCTFTNSKSSNVNVFSKPIVSQGMAQSNVPISDFDFMSSNPNSSLGSNGSSVNNTANLMNYYSNNNPNFSSMNRNPNVYHPNDPYTSNTNQNPDAFSGMTAKRDNNKSRNPFDDGDDDDDDKKGSGFDFLR